MTFVLTSDDGVLTDDDDDTINYDTRAEAEDKKSELNGLFDNLEVEQKGVEEVDPEVIDMSDQNGGNTDNDDDLPGVDVCINCGNEITDGHCPNCEDDETNGLAEPVKDAEQPADQLPESTSVDEDPVSWMPSHFVDEIDSTYAINRKGYAVLAEHYDISVKAGAVTYPSESDFEYAEFEAVAITADGQEYSGFGSAHIERGDDKTLLGEMAETRAVKRSLALATGVGMSAVEELQAATVGGDRHE